MRRLFSVALVIAACSEPAPADPIEGESGSTAATEEDASSSTGEEMADASSSTGDEDESSSSGGGFEGPIDGRNCPPDNGLTAANFGMPFLLTWCAGCHNSALTGTDRADAPPGVDFETIDGAQTHLLRIFEQSGDANAGMPPSGGPTESDRQLLGDWLACGAPE